MHLRTIVFLFFACSDAFTPHVTTRIIHTALREQQSSTWFFADKQQVKSVQNDDAMKTRVLGSQELLMAPRQYSLSSDTFPSMNHVACALLSATPDTPILRQALEYVMQTHPLLRAKIIGDGEPEKRIDLLQMVRKGEPNPMQFKVDSSFTVDSVLKMVDTDDLETSWRSAFTRDLDQGTWCDVAVGPLWKLEWHREKKSGKCALVFAFNHAISDQSSVNRLVDQIIRKIVALENGEKLPLQPQGMPMALEDSVLGMQQRWSDVQMGGVTFDTIQYVASKAAEELKKPVILPDSFQRKTDNTLGALTIISGQTAGGMDTEQRKSVVQFRSLSPDTTAALLSKCRVNGVSVTNALTAAVTLTATDFVGDGGKRNYKILQSLDMRRFGQQLDQGETVACMAGSMDLMHGPLQDRSGEKVRSGKDTDLVWKLAKEGKEQTKRFIEKGGPEQAVRVFDFAMTVADLNNLVYLTAQSKDTKGRAYSAGIANIGVFENQSAFGKKDGTLKSRQGRYQVEDMFFASSQVQSGCLYQVSCMTVDGKLELTFHPVSPIVTDETNQKFADAFVELLEIMAGTKSPTQVESSKISELALPDNILTTVAAVVGIASVLSHAGAWVDFFRSVSEMKANIADPADFWAAINFWIFFAVGHPLLQPILYLSDVLHGSPGPLVGNLVPFSFLAGNAVVLYAITQFKDLRNAVNIAVLAAFFSYVGAGLDGTAGLGDFNLALDDNYKGQIVKGCPAYEDVRQPSMNDFDINKYQGMWYEQKFHDWTQFKEVYDTSLDIKLTEGGKGWVDDFGVKGPAPDAAPLSWDKSPVANGAHYFLFGRVDDRDPPGILREKGFGVEFPNYIVDVMKDPKTGEYTESIQFQCLERGGVRVFEGINFMSRNKVMTEEELGAMHARAEKAGMYPYGASPEQMHRVAQRPENAPAIDNNWQAMWRAIGLDKLLELLTESIEDGGRE